MALVGCLVLSLIMVWLLLSGSAQSITWAYIGVAFFGAGAVVLALLFFRPGKLVLGPDGLTWTANWRTFHYDWSDIEGFIVFSPSIFLRYPAFIYSENCPKQKIARVFSGGIGSFGGLWELGTPEMLEVLKKAKVHWTKP